MVLGIMKHDTTSDETTEEMNAGCGGPGSSPYLPNCLVVSTGSLSSLL